MLRLIIFSIFVLWVSVKFVSAQEDGWQVELADHGLVSPRVDSEVVYVGTHGGGLLFAVDAATGEERWSRNELGEHVTPVVTQGENVLFGGSAGIFYALDRTNGETHWQFDVGEGIWGAPLLHEDTVYFGTDRGSIYALNITNGEIIWQTSVSNQIVSDFVFEDELLYVAAGGSLLALSLEDGQIVWEQTGGRWSNPVVQSGTVYAGNEDGRFYAVDALTGEEGWSFEGKSGRLAWAAPAVYSTMVYAGNRSNGLFALDVETGGEVWRLPVENNISVSPPLVFEDRLYVGTGDLNNRRKTGLIYQLDPQTGEMLDQFETNTAVVNAPFIDTTGIIYAGTTTGVLYAVRFK